MVVAKSPFVLLIVLFAFCALMTSKTSAHFSLGRELKLPTRQDLVNPVNPERSFERGLYEKERRKTGIVILSGYSYNCHLTTLIVQLDIATVNFANVNTTESPETTHAILQL